MLWIATVVLLVLWLVGMIEDYTLGGTLHLILVLFSIMAMISILKLHPRPRGRG